jgi:hypothetical protein
MSKIIFEFDGIEEASEARDAMNGSQWRIAMWSLDQELRKTTKYGSSILDSSKEASVEEVEVCGQIRDTIRQIMSNYNLSLED